MSIIPDLVDLKNQYLDPISYLKLIALKPDQFNPKIIPSIIDFKPDLDVSSAVFFIIFFPQRGLINFFLFFLRRTPLRSRKP